MNTCEDVVIYRKHLTKEGIGWIVYRYCPFSVCFKELLLDNTNNSYSCGDVTVRIRTDESICKVGDMLEFGVGSGFEPPEDAFEVTAVTENFKGSEDMWHVKITAK